MGSVSCIIRRGLQSTPLFFSSLAFLGCSRGPTAEWRPRDFFANANVIALALAAERGDTKEIDRLVSAGTDVNTRGKDGMTPLLWAMWAKNKVGFLQLLERGADPNLQLTGGSSIGSSVTSWSARAENDSEWLEIVLKHGADPNLVNPGGSGSTNKTPIFDAIDSREARNLDLLIKAGAKLDYRDSCGNTPMMYAAGANWFDSVYRLLEAGADYRIRDNYGYDLADEVVNSRVDRQSDSEQWRQKVIAFLSRDGVNFDLTRKKLVEKGEFRGLP